MYNYIQIEREELTKTFMMISNWKIKNTLGPYGLNRNISPL